MLRVIKKNGVFSVIQILILLIIGATCVIHKLSPLVGVEYFAFQLLAVFVPGLALTSILKPKANTRITVVGYSYALGLALLLVQYLLLVPFGIGKYALFLVIAIDILSVLVLLKNKNFISLIDDSGDKKSRMFCLLLVVAVFAIDFFTISMVNTLPNEVEPTGYYADWLFWIGNNIEMAKEFPPQNFRLVGGVFGYHYFSSIFVSQTYLITKIDIKILSFYFSYIIPAILLVLSGYEFLGKVIKKKSLFWIALIGLLFTDGTSVTYIWHIYICPFGYDLAMIFGMYAVANLLEVIEKDKIDLRLLILSSVMLALCTGCKGPVGMVLLMGFGIIGIYFLFTKKIKCAFGYGAPWLAAFVGVYFGFITPHGESNFPKTNVVASPKPELSVRGLDFVGFTGEFAENKFIQQIFNHIPESIPRVLRVIASFVLYVFQVNNFCMILLAIGVIVTLVMVIKKKAKIWQIAFIGISFFGILMALITVQSGNSQMYFVMAIIPYAIGLGMFAFEKIISSNIKGKKVISIICAVAIGLSCVSGFYFSAKKYIGPKAIEGLKCITGQSYHNEIDRQDYDLALWLKENTDVNDVIAVDYLVGDDCENEKMHLGVFSERYIWNDGKYTTNSEVYRRQDIVENVSSTGSVSELEKENVDYFVITKENNSSFDLSNNIYENEDYAVLAVK